MSTICVIGDVHGHIQLALCMAARRQQEDGFCTIQFGEEITIRRENPDFWREYRRRKWKEIEGFGVVCPDLLDRK